MLKISQTFSAWANMPCREANFFFDQICPESLLYCLLNWLHSITNLKIAIIIISVSNAIKAPVGGNRCKFNFLWCG